jgi:hypothetical protein
MSVGVWVGVLGRASCVCFVDTGSEIYDHHDFTVKLDGMSECLCVFSLPPKSPSQDSVGR